MNKTDLINRVAASTKYTRKDVQTILDAILTEVKESLSLGEHVALSRFGTFSAQIVPPQEAKKTALNGGMVTSVPRTAKIRFRPSETMKKVIAAENKAPVRDKSS